MNRIKYIFWLLLPLLILTAGCTKKNEKAQPPKEVKIVNVRVMELSLTDTEEYTNLSGVVRPWKEALISSEEGGTVENVFFDKGDKLIAGSPLAEIDRTMVKAILDEAEADLLLRNAGFVKAKKLHDNKSITDMEMLQAKTARDASQARVDQARVRYERASLKSPIKGVVAEKYIEIGELTAPGSPVAKIENIEKVKIITEIPERDIAFYKKGGNAQVKTSAYENITFPGTIHHISPSANERSRTFSIELKVNNSRELLRPGMICDVSLLKKKHYNIFLIPQDSIMDCEKGRFVFVASSENESVLKYVQVNAVVGNSAVIGKGLSQGDRLIIEGHRELSAGEKLRIINKQEKI